MYNTCTLDYLTLIYNIIMMFFDKRYAQNKVPIQFLYSLTRITHLILHLRNNYLLNITYILLCSNV